MSDGLPYAGDPAPDDPLYLLMQQAGFNFPRPKGGLGSTGGQMTGQPYVRSQGTAPSRSFLHHLLPAATRAPQGGQMFAPQGVDPTNPIDQQGAGIPAGVQVDPRFLAMQAVNPGVGQMRPPMVGVDTPNPHPTLTAIAYGLQHALANQPITGRTRGADAFLGGLLGGASDVMVNADQKRQALNTSNRTAAAQMNLMNAAISAQKAKAGTLTPDAESKNAAAEAPIQLGSIDVQNLSPYLSDEQRTRAAVGKLTRSEYDRAMQSAALDIRKHPAVRAAVGVTTPTAPLIDEALNQAADTYFRTGSFSGVSSRDMDARRLIINRSAERHPGAVIPANTAEYKANAASLVGVQKSADATAVFINQLHRNVAMIEPLLAQMSDTGSPFFNKPLRDISSNVFGSKEIPAYNFVMETVRKEANRILTAGPSMAGQVGEQEQKAMRSVIDGNSTAAQLRETVNVVLRESENRTSAYNQQIADIKKRLNPAGPNPNFLSPAPTTPAAPVVPQSGGFWHSFIKGGH